MMRLPCYATAQQILTGISLLAIGALTDLEAQESITIHCITIGNDLKRLRKAVSYTQIPKLQLGDFLN